MERGDNWGGESRDVKEGRRDRRGTGNRKHDKEEEKKRKNRRGEGCGRRRRDRRERGLVRKSGERRTGEEKE